MTFSETAITDVALDVSGETPDIGQAAAEDLKAALMAAQAKGEIEVQVITEKAEEDDGDWLGTEPEIDESQITQTYETDILVIGCGTGGMFTMASAAEEGAKVIGIDRFPTGVGIRDELGVIDWYGDRLAERGVQLWHESGDTDDEARYKHYPTGHSPLFARIRSPAKKP